MSTTLKTVTGTLASAVADAGTFTVSYPDRSAPEKGATDAGCFFQGQFHRLYMNGALLLYPDDVDLSFGASSITVTNKLGATWPAGAAWILQLDEPGRKVYGPDADGKAQPVARAALSDAVLISLGAPDILDADGICASQSIAAGTASTTTAATLDGALATTNAVTGLREVVLDTPRNVVAAWTTTAVLTIEGYDEYGTFMVEKSASGTSHTGKKAFKRISKVWSTVAITSASVGTGDVLGLPVYLPGRQHVLAEILDGSLVGDRNFVRIPFVINATDLAAGTKQFVYCPVAGRVARFSTVVQTTLAATAAEIGQVHLTVNGSAVTNSTLTTYGTAGSGSGTVGDVASVLIAADVTNAAVAAGDFMEVVPGSTWASAGALNGMIEIAPTGSGIYTQSGTFAMGLTTSGGSTATTADTRGTYAPPVAMNGSIVVQLLVSLPDKGSRGPTQFATP